MARWWKMSAVEIAEARRKAWETRRAKYGKRGHRGVYERGSAKASIAVRDEMRLARLVAVVAGEGMLSEGQLAKILELDRVAVRRLEDEGLTCLSYRPLTGDWGARQMRRLLRTSASVEKEDGR